MAACGDAAAAVEMAAPKPRSPPSYPDFCGRRRLQLEVQMLNREIGFLQQEELQGLDGVQSVSRSCKEVNEFVGTNPDPLIPVNKRRRRSYRIWKWIRVQLCFDFSWICCFCQCSLRLKKPSCTCLQPENWSCCCCSNCCKCGCPSCSCGEHSCCCKPRCFSQSCCCKPRCCSQSCCSCGEHSCCCKPRCCSQSCCRPWCCSDVSCCKPRCAWPRSQCCSKLCQSWNQCCSKLCQSWNLLCCAFPSCSCPEYSCGCVWSCPKCSDVFPCTRCSSRCSSKTCCISGCLC